MIVNQRSLSNMQLLPLSLCLLTLTGSTFSDGNGPVIITVTKGDDVTLPCNINKNIESERFEWMKDGKKEVYLYEGTMFTDVDPQFRGRVSHFGDHELKNGDASITISDTKVSDSGVYTCNFPNLHQTFRVRLVVGGELKDRSGEFKDACSKPSITLFREAKDGVLLQCEVSDASPGFKLNISWLNSSRNKLAEQIKDTERGKPYILQTTVTKSDTYRCVATMEELSHQVYSETYVHVPGSSGLSVAPSLITVVLFLALLVTVG